MIVSELLNPSCFVCEVQAVHIYILGPKKMSEKYAANLYMIIYL